MIYASVRCDFPRWSVTFEVEYFNNQLTIPDYSLDEPSSVVPFSPVSSASATADALIFDYRPTRRTAFSVDGDYRSRVRVDRGGEITEDIARAQLNSRSGR